jgi:trans-aconitate methyltransferase
LQLALVNPSLTAEDIKASQGTVAQQRAQLQALRQQREALAAARDAATTALRQAEAVLRDAHYERLQQRQKLLEQQAMQVRQMPDWLGLKLLSVLDTAAAGKLMVEC